jgi:hypothetical protein
MLKLKLNQFTNIFVQKNTFFSGLIKIPSYNFILGRLFKK